MFLLLSVSHVKAETVVSCNIVTLWFAGYSCEFDSISYLEEGEDFIIEVEHDEGFTDEDVIVVFNSFSNMSYVPKEIIQKFPNVEQLLLSQSRMESIDGAFEVCGDKIEIMTFYRNNLKRIPSRGFERCTGLLSLDFGDNQISDVPVDAFAGLEKLETLDLYKNPITSIDSRLFENLSNLLYLYSDDLDVQDMDSKLFQNLKNVQRLYFGSKLEQEYVKIQSGTFKSLPKLETLQITFKAEEMEIEPLAFQELESLQRLVLSGNGIKRLNSNSFSDIPNLTWLNLRGNNLSAVEKNFFEQFSKLEEVLANDNECVDKAYYIESPLDEEFVKEFEECFKNWEGDETTTTALPETTTTELPETTTTELPETTTTKIPETTTENPDESTTLGSSSIISSCLTIFGLLMVLMIISKTVQNQ